MAINAVVAGLLLVLLVVAIVTIVLGMRHRLAFRIAMRNVRRGRTRTVLLIAGLLVGTVIITGSLIVGDTVQELAYHYTYLGAGYVDESIEKVAPSGALGFYPYSVYTRTLSNVSGNSEIVGVAPEIVGSASAYDVNTGIPETALNLIAVNGNQSQALGTFVADNGTSIEGPAPGEVLIDQQTASALNASTGDTLQIYAATMMTLKVQAIVQPNVRGAFITAGLSPGNLFVTLSVGQQLEQAPGYINYIAITNVGTQAEGAASSSSVSAYLNQTLAPLLSEYGLTVTTPLADALNTAAMSASSITTLFLALGLFSILAGAMLIVGIFVMLAEERKGEMGMLRAIGMRRRELVYTYFFEGVAYSAGSALAGVVVGVGVGYLLVLLADSILAAEGLPPTALLQSFTVTNESLVIAYVAGFLLTLVTVFVACRRASRLNIVRAIRDIPEPKPPVRTYTFLAYLGAALIAIGVYGYYLTYQGTGNIAYPIIMGALVILGAGLIAARFVLNRWAFTAVGAALIVWAGYEPLHVTLFGTAHSGGIFNLFVVGVILVGGAILIVLLNAGILARILRRLFGRWGQSSPVVRIGLDYPTRQPSRTAVSLTIFALVVFTMVATAAAGSTLEGSLNDRIQTESGGYTYFGYSNTGIPDLWSDISSNATLAPLFSNAVSMYTGVIDVNVPGYSMNPYFDSIYAAPTNATGPADFYSTNQFSFQSTVNGSSASATFQELATNPSVAVVDESYANVANAFATGASNHPKLNVGTTIRITNPGGGHPTNLTVIGILSQQIVSGVWVNPATALAMGYTSASAYYLTAAPGVSTTYAAQQVKKAFFPEGMVLFNLQALLAQSIATTESFIGVLEVFVGLGLAVGIAAMGIFALRAVVERRREIGMLRATGFTQGMVLRAFFLEYSFVTLLGVVIGTALGLLTIYNVSVSPEAATDGLQTFVVPYLTVFEIAAIAYVLVLVAIAAPSLRAAHLPPAEAVRTTE